MQEITDLNELMKKRLLFVLGTRPEGIKLAPLILECQRQTDVFTIEICITGQHQQMLQQVLTLFNLLPDYDLALMQQGQDLFDLTARILLQMRDVLKKSQPDLVLVHGDTATSTAAALAAFYQKIPVAHVEAGLRTYNLYSPWPEEANRQLTSRLATYHFAPTHHARKNLESENIQTDQILVTGNTVIDALHLVVKRFETDVQLEDSAASSIREAGYSMSRVKDGKRLVLITGHRRESFGQGIVNICQAIRTLADKFEDVDFVYPVHLNPQVQQPVRQILGVSASNNIYLIDPLDYLSFIYLMKTAYLLVSDSGGVQEEAPSLGKPVLVTRDTTERPEAVQAGTVRLVGTDTQCIINAVSELLNDEQAYQRMSLAHNPYGDGTTSRQIVAYLRQQMFSTASPLTQE